MVYSISLSAYTPSAETPVSVQHAGALADRGPHAVAQLLYLLNILNISVIIQETAVRREHILYCQREIWQIQVKSIFVIGRALKSINLKEL